MSSQFTSAKTLKMIENLFSWHNTDAVYIVACDLLNKRHPLKKHVLEACAILRLINDQDADNLADMLFEWYHFWYTSQIMIEHASVRQNVKRGYILIEKNPAETYARVLSWHIYPNMASVNTALQEVSK